MHFSTMIRGILTLTALSGTAAGIITSPFKRDLKLSAELGIHPDILLSQKTTVHDVTNSQLDASIEAEYISVCLHASQF